MVPDIGQRYGPYQILSPIDGGGMGHVFKAWDARLHREVAIKLLHSEFIMPGMRERFLREARAASALNHPNICTIFDIGEQGGEPYLVMEMLHGSTLKQRIQHQVIQVDELISIAREVAEALAAAHAKGVVHRDIKPANIFLVEKPNKTFQAKVLDFGLAKFEGGAVGARTSRSLDLTAAGATVGTLAYMSPEQARGETLDSRSDLFSLGIVMYEMATRRIPFRGATSALVFVQLLNHPPEPVRDWNEAIPRELEKIILKLMAKERTARFQTAQELDEALAKFTEKGSAGWLRKVTATVPLVRAPEPVARERRISRRKAADSRIEEPGALPSSISEPASPSTLNLSEAQVLRPVARVPSMVRSHVPRENYSTSVSALATASPVPAFSVAAAEPAPAEDASPLQTAAADDASGNVQLAASAGSVDQEYATAEFAAALPEFAADTASPESAGNRWSWPLLILFAVLACCVVAAVVIWLRPGHFGSPLLSRNDSVVLTQIENKTGDASLDGVVTEGLQLALSQSPLFNLRSGQTYRLARLQISPDEHASTPILSRKVAERLASKAYLLGSLKGSAAPYTLHVDLVNTASSDAITSVEEQVPTLADLPSAIDRVATKLRQDVGEDKDSIRRTSLPLSREATENLQALHAFNTGQDSLAAGNLELALQAFQQAAKLDPQFTQAHLQLAVAYRRQRAEVASAESAKVARETAAGRSERTQLLAEYEYEMNATGDYAKATTIIRKLTGSNPRDAEALDFLARTLRLEGRFADSLQTAQQAYAEDPYNLDAYTQAQNALIGLERYEAASQLGTQVKAMHIGSLGGDIVSSYLEGRQEDLSAAIALINQRKTGYRPDWSLGLYLDNVGRLNEGNAVWHQRAQAAQQLAGLDSASAFLLSQSAIDRALLGECPGALTAAHESDAHQQGITALFNNGMAYALCGDSGHAAHIAETLQRTYPQSFAVRGFYLADIQAAIALASNDPAAALEIVKPARQYDLISITPMLRGRAHVALKQVQIGIVDFQTVLSHRGVPFIVGSVVYPVAEIGVARAFAATGDLGNSAAAYRAFLQLWKGADPKQPLLLEAAAHSH